MKAILFKTDMIKAIAEGRKTVTRRLHGLKEVNKEPDAWTQHNVVNDYPPAKIGDWIFIHLDGTGVLAKPRYRVGEIVYIKEGWCAENKYNKLKPSELPDDAKIWYLSDVLYDPFILGIKRSPLFLPEHFARYFVKILSNRTERLQEITTEEIIKEGLSSYLREYDAEVDLREQWVKLWNSLNPSCPWDLNPWCWRHEFVLEV